jgi:putative colanic acid biosynthesis UDP-glucose lipid carrier transferase
MIISILGFYLFEYQIYNISYFIIYLIIVGWIGCCVYSFYDVYRFTALLKFFKIVKQGVLFSLIVIALFSVFKTICF